MNILRPSDIAGIIRDNRIKKGLSQAKLAENIGVSRKWVNELEQDGGTAKVGLVLHALNELGITLHAFGPDEKLDPINTSRGSTRKTIDIDIDAIADMGLGND